MCNKRSIVLHMNIFCDTHTHVLAYGYDMLDYPGNTQFATGRPLRDGVPIGQAWLWKQTLIGSTQCDWTEKSTSLSEIGNTSGYATLLATSGPSHHTSLQQPPHNLAYPTGSRGARHGSMIMYNTCLVFCAVIICHKKNTLYFMYVLY